MSFRGKSRNLRFYSNRPFEAARDVSTSVDMTLCDLLENCFVEANPALEIFERKIFVRRMRAAIGQRKSQQQRFDAQNTAELRNNGNAAAFTNQRGVAIERLPQRTLRRFTDS